MLQRSLFEPKSDWLPDTTFPDLSGAKEIGFDVETRDPNLKEKGPGGVRNDGYIAGISVATDTGFSAYYPIRHLDGGNLDASVVLPYIRDVLGNPNQLKVGANVIYDLEWLRTDGVEVRGPLHDVQIAEALIDEESDEGYSLEHLSRKYIGTGKEETLLKQALSAFQLRGKGDLWKINSRYVGPYAQIDAVNPLRIKHLQQEEITRQGLTDIFSLESRVTRVLFESRWRGVKVNQEGAQHLAATLKKKEDQLRRDLADRVGFFVDEWSNKSIAKAAVATKAEFGRTAKGNPTFNKAFLKSSGHWLYEAIERIRTVNRLRTTYIEGTVLGDADSNGIIHTQYNQMVGDEDGTRTGRLSSSNPNLQQVPARDPELAPLIRALFVPFGKHWTKLDYSQQEPRILVHFSYLMGFEGAADFRQHYIDDPDMDFYIPIMNMSEISRREAKDCALGRMYNMGIPKFAAKINTDEQRARDIMDKFDQSVPFVKKIGESCTYHAGRRGYVKTLLGRKRHFNLWKPRKEWEAQGVDLETAKQKWPDEVLERAYTHKALNSLIQGSAADMTKKALVDCYDAGQLFTLQVHDELNFSHDDPEEGKLCKEIMENCVEMTVPIVADLDIGEHWK